MTIGRGSHWFSVSALALDVSDAVPVDERCVIEGSLFLPDALPESPKVVIAIPGATYSHRYWDLQPPGHAGYSQARYYAERGVVFAAVDYLGGGELARPLDGDAITISVVADAAHHVFEQLRDGLRAGTFGAGPLEDAVFVGLGQSMGGNALIVQQARYADYAAVAMLGTSALAVENMHGVALPENWDELTDEEKRAAVRANNEAVIGAELTVYHGASRELLRDSFFSADVTDELVRYDVDHVATLMPRNAGVDTMTPGFFAPYASQITSPVFLGFGEPDISQEPRREPAAYTSSRDISLSVVPAMAHMHNFHPTRKVLWDRLLTWLDGLHA